MRPSLSGATRLVPYRIGYDRFHEEGAVPSLQPEETVGFSALEDGAQKGKCPCVLVL